MCDESESEVARFVRNGLPGVQFTAVNKGWLLLITPMRKALFKALSEATIR